MEGDMTTTFIATGQADHFTEFHFSQSFSLANGTEDFQFASPVEPYNGFFEQFNSSPQATSLATSLISQITSIANSLNVDTFALFAFELFDDTLVDYSLSTAPVFIDLEQSVQSGGFAQGDILTQFKDAALPPVFATPMMVTAMENAALNAVRAYLEPNESAVGTWINVRHLAATPAGHRITAEAEVTKVDGRRIEFKVSARDDTEEIGSGTHERMVVDRARLAQRLKAKRRGASA